MLNRCYARRLVLAIAVILLANASVIYAATTTVAWDANSEPDVAGYKLSYGTQSGTYTTVVDVGKVTTTTVTLTDGVRYYFAVQAYNTGGLISAYSTEVVYDVPVANPPTLTTLSPVSGPVGTSVTITGTNFGSAQGASTVSFGGVTATPTAWSATSIAAPVPSGASTGNVVVTVGGSASNALPFTVTVPPNITSLSPTSGPVGTSVTIAGSDFGATKGTSTVTFNGTQATPSSWSATSIVVPVPTGATTGSVVVTVGGLASSGVTFTVRIPPNITSLSPTSGTAGTSVTITGTNFGATKGSSTVTFKGVVATTTSWSNTSIVATVPATAATGSVIVTVNSLASTGVTFTVTVPTPTITSLSPTSGTVGTTVTITGTNFGTTQGTSTVKFNGVTATVSSWSATSIVVLVPASAMTGNVVVTVGGVSSPGVSFNVVPLAPGGLRIVS
jgi:hypothetical protein